MEKFTKKKFHMAAKFKMASPTYVFSCFKHLKFSFFLKLMEVAISNNTFQIAGHLRSAKKYNCCINLVA